jgi:hypothetical protein
MNRGLGTALLAVALVSGAVDLAFARAGGRGAAAGGVPNFDVGPSCRASSSPDCAIQEQTAHDMLIKKWPGFTAQVKATCAGYAKEAGPPSYIEWLTCLETYENMR